LRRTLDQNPNEIFLVEGYTDAVGPPEDNLSLSDRRAETVATVLSQSYGIPAENLTTQGFGEQDLKVNTQESERRNRRVTIRRITPLLQGQR
jgi:outer membrane protein OmpA-like peptidoglycan-associated protein